MNTINLFYAYARQDESFRKELEEHLAVLRREGIIREWHDKMLIPGETWDDTIKRELEKANVIVLLISSSFLSSDYINDVEIKKALERQRKGEAMIIPVICRACDWENSILSKFQVLPQNAEPISLWDDKDSAYKDVVQGIRKLIKKGKQSKTAKPVKIPYIRHIILLLVLIFSGFIFYSRYVPSNVQSDVITPNKEVNSLQNLKKIRDDFNLNKHSNVLLDSIFVKIEKVVKNDQNSLSEPCRKEYALIIDDLFDRIEYSLKNIDKNKEVEKNENFIRYYLKILDYICLRIQICIQDDLKLIKELKLNYEN